jgi:hypothetical protein
LPVHVKLAIDKQKAIFGGFVTDVPSQCWILWPKLYNCIEKCSMLHYITFLMQQLRRSEPAFIIVMVMKLVSVCCMFIFRFKLNSNFQNISEYWKFNQSKVQRKIPVS